ncbi:hypothetical protein [Qipengyuania marisflavi]|uniref:Uncharacterized protein n=1 Tax=Qipengyuania marisflavi TaxID=2486356 RepID=A0A5S3P7B6_9SPHN|nr:hypothetical protein [Qipengyuania marisflavi]TMM46746.1 hypothetical protein FEV51_10970 [Qipengyuania marisflavi]
MDHGDAPVLEDTAVSTPSLVAHARFFVRRHPVSVLFPLALFVGAGAALLVAISSGLWAAGKGPVFALLATPGFALIAIAFMPIILARKRIASIQDIAAALAAATAYERPILIAKIDERLRSRVELAPMTTFQLALIFEEVRERHGQRARNQGCAGERIKTAQLQFVSQIAASGEARARY